MKTFLILFAAVVISYAEEAPRSLSISPAEVVLDGPRARQQLLVTGDFDEGLEADLTDDEGYLSLDPKVVAVTRSGLVVPRGDGEAEVLVRRKGLEAGARVRVVGFARVDPVDFRTEVIAALGRGGCNQGACHGSPHGKNGFRLSLRGSNPDLDIVTLTHEAFGRRTDRIVPSASLILLKATARTPHQGGPRLREGDPAYELLRTWIGEGARDVPSPRALMRLEVLPTRRSLHTSTPRQQIVVRAHGADGSVRDVTGLSVFSSSDEATAPVTPDGLVRFRKTAEVAILVRFLDRIVSVPLRYVRHDPAFVFSGPSEANFIDRHAFAKLRALQLDAAPLATDAVFLRRVHLDLIGTLPTPAEARAFLDSTGPRRRVELIDALLDRGEFAQFWAMKWADVMRGNREAITERGAHNFHRYLVRSFAEDRPFDQFARDVLTSQGNTIDEPSANFYRIARTPDDAAESMSQLFLGVRIQCAKCHNHPYEAIAQGDYYGFAAYFARVRLKGKRLGRDDEWVYLARDGEVKDPNTGKVLAPSAFGEPVGPLGPDDDRRDRLAGWLTHPRNRYFARATVNRVWSHLLGRGLVEPIDDFRETNPPSDTALLDALAEEFVRGGYRLKPLIRTILNSHTYQLAAEPPAGPSPFAADPGRYFASAEVRMLTAEQVFDAIASATGVPVRVPGYPAGTRAIELAEGEVDQDFLKAFTKPVRNEGCDCARETEPSLNEVIHLINNPDVLSQIESPEGRLARALNEGRTAEQVIDLLYLATLSRRPTPEETRLATRHIHLLGDSTAGLRDLQHALINSNEFLLRH